MNEPIVSPWLVYLFGVAEPVQICATLISIVGAVAWVISRIYLIDEGDDKMARSIRNLARIWFVTLPIALFIPTKSTMIGMVVAQNITPANINTALEAGRDFKNELKRDIIDLLNGKTEEKKETK